MIKVHCRVARVKDGSAPRAYMPGNTMIKVHCRVARVKDGSAPR